uniref:Reverse transcriptase domain-containing protein n=1 Tax=Tanacetum cinerariifolium TaxID=118510 RepID=A0A6L2N9R2_TANCI|nr:hypothetical protein [Tanacetum cinerariifolium]
MNIARLRGNSSNQFFFFTLSKISNPLSVKDFRPISLIGTHYKIISKLFANRLSKVIDEVVSKEQFAFISGRQILDGPLIISEIIQWYKNRKKKMLIFKVDFEKTFDSVSWKASILINGSPTSEFSIKCGLRQGDPLSPFLFILVMEGLLCAMSNAVNSGLISGIKLGSSGIVLSHLFYADDVILTTDWNPHDIDNIIRVLYVFHLASGLKINIHKSNIFGIRVTNDEISSMASRTGCAVGCLPFTYLGLPIGANMNLTSSWQILIDHFQKRLSLWKANLLSIGGRLTLIKVVLGSLDIYYLSIFKAPETILNSMESLRSRFFWGGSQDSRNMESDIGTRNTAYLNDLLLEISQIDISMDEDTYSLPHHLNLSSRGLNIPTISCSSCNGNVESANHVFFEYDLVKEIWCLVRKWCNISIPTFASYDTWNSWFSTWQATKAKSRRLYIIFAALFWWIWRCRNSVTFSSDSIKKDDLFDNIRASSSSWISNWGHVLCNWVEWLKNPLLIAGS